MPGKKGGTKRGAEAVADASAKKGRRASEADVALRLGDELGEHTIDWFQIYDLVLSAQFWCSASVNKNSRVR